MTQNLPCRLDTTGVIQADLRSALWLPPKLAIEVLANLTTALVYCETMIWQYRQRWLDQAHHHGFWSLALEQALDSCVAEYTRKLDQIEEGQVAQCLQVETKPINGGSTTVGDHWRVQSNNPFLVRSATSRPHRVRQKGLRMKKNIRILIQHVTQETLNQLDEIVNEYRS